MATLLALLSSLLWGSADYHAGNLSKRYPAIAVLGINQAFGLLFGLTLAISTHAWTAQALGLHGYVLSGILAGFSGYCGLICLYAGLSTGRMGVVSPISSLSVLIPLAYALVYKGDHLTPVLTVGVVLAASGGILASGPELSQGFSLKPVLLAIGAACGFGVALTFMALGSESSPLMTMTTMRASTLLISLGIALHYKSLGGVKRGSLPLLAGVGIADFSANLLLGVATTKGLVSLAMVLGALYPIATALLAFKFLHERLHKIQYVGVALAIAGVSIISAF
jgi:drug/metabolite transporter (DMT)-like permease